MVDLPTERGDPVGESRFCQVSSRLVSSTVGIYVVGLGAEPAGHLGELVGRDDVDGLVVGDVTDGVAPWDTNRGPSLQGGWFRPGGRKRAVASCRDEVAAVLAALRDPVDDARGGVANARRRLRSLVHEPALADTSAIDRSFLLAMAQDDGPSKMAEIQARLNVDVNYVSQYRLRLIAAELIESVRREYVDFALPYLHEYLRYQAAADI